MDTKPDKSELLDTMRAERAYFEELLARVGEEKMAQPGVDGNGEWSVKDILAHVAAYEEWTAGEIRAAITGEPAPPNEDDEAHQEDWWETNRRNARIYILNRDRPLEEIMAKSRQAFERLLAAVEMIPEEDLSGPQEWTYGEPLAKMIPVQSYAHYQDHTPAIQAWLDKQTAKEAQGQSPAGNLELSPN
jgi:Protein of unknown function (DUF1706)